MASVSLQFHWVWLSHVSGFDYVHKSIWTTSDCDTSEWNVYISTEFGTVSVGMFVIDLYENKKNRCELLFLVDSENDIFICGVDYPAEVKQAQTQLLLNQLLVNIHRILFKNFWSKKYIFKQNAKKLHKNHITQNDNLPKYSLGLGILFHWKWVFFWFSNSKNSKSNRNYCGIIPKCEQLERHRVCHRWTVSDTKIIAYDFVAQYFIACDVPI